MMPGPSSSAPARLGLAPVPHADSRGRSTRSFSITPSSPFQLREYQNTAIATILEALEEGKTRIGISSPTGSGKTAMFLHLIPALRKKSFWKTDKKTLIIVHTQDLAGQICDVLDAHCADVKVGIEQGGLRVRSACRMYVICLWLLA